MTDIITVRGYVATDVRLTLAQSGLPIAGFRMCTTERRFDKEANAWVDGQTNWFSVSMFRQLATNAGASIKKGDRVIITGRLKVRPWINADGRTGTSVEIDADSAGHDLMWGTANFRRTATDRTDNSGAAAQHSDGPVSGDGIPDGVDVTTGELFEDQDTFREDTDKSGDEPVEDSSAAETDGRHGTAREEAAVPF